MASGPNQIRVPIYLDATTLAQSSAQVQALVRQMLMQAGGGKTRAVGELYGHPGRLQEVFGAGEGPSGAVDPVVGVKQQSEAISRTQSNVRERLMMRAELLQAENKISADTLAEFKKSADLEKGKMRTNEDLKMELDRAVHAQRLSNASNRSNATSANRIRRAMERRDQILGEAQRRQAKAADNLARIQERAAVRMRRATRRVARNAEKEAEQGVRGRMDLLSQRAKLSTNMIMGMGGIATAASMPISGFTPLTIAFAGMSGPQYAAGAASAVFVRAIIDASRAVVMFQSSLVEAAKSFKFVSEEYKQSQFEIQARQIFQGGVASIALESRYKKLNKTLDDNIKLFTDMNLTVGNLRTSIADLAMQTGLNVLTAGGRIGAGILGGIGVQGNQVGSLISIISPMLTQAFGDALAMTSEQQKLLLPRLRMMIQRLEGGDFRAQFIGPEELYQRIQAAAVSSDQAAEDRKKIIEILKKQLEKLEKEDARREAEKLEKETGDILTRMRDAIIGSSIPIFR